MLKKIGLCVATLVLGIVFMTSTAHAIAFSINPISQNVLLGNSVGVSLDIYCERVNSKFLFRQDNRIHWI